MAIDGTLEDVADTPENVRFFGRLHDGATRSPYPQARCVHLSEVGTHAIIDRIIAPCKADERCLSWGVLRSIVAGMLVLLDRGFVSGAFFEARRGRGAQVVARLPQGIFRTPQRVLSDGSYLVTLTPQACAGLSAPMQVRVIEYFIKPEVAEPLAAQPTSRMSSHSTDGNPAIWQKHRLLTTLLDPLQAPALEICLLYHERWEIELAIDELKNHQRLSQLPLRSQLPVLVLQELYALLLAHSAIQVLRVCSAQSHALDPDRISFTGSLQILTDALVLGPLVEPTQVPHVRQRMQDDLALPTALVQRRRLRFNCRVVKHICTRFRCKRPHHVNLTLHDTSFSDILLI
jgi:Transposase DDE domain